MEYIIYIGAALVIGLLIGFVALSIVWLRKTMVRNIRSHTLDLISVYDDLLEEKSRELSDLKAELQAQEIGSEEEWTRRPGEEAYASVQSGISPSTLLEVAERAAEASYRDSSIGATYYQIRKNFSFQMGEVLPILEAESRLEEGPAGRLLQILDYETVYSLSTLTEQEQMAILMESLPQEGLDLLEEYQQAHGTFSIFGFYDSLKSWKAEEPQEPKLYVPEGMAFGAQSDSTVGILTDQEICEGFQVEMGGKLYDYCIKTKELS